MALNSLQTSFGENSLRILRAPRSSSLPVGEGPILGLMTLDWRRDPVLDAAVPSVITCIDCGSSAHLLTVWDEYPPVAGDIATYRCRDCLDRWDLVIEIEDLGHQPVRAIETDFTSSGIDIPETIRSQCREAPGG
jgi:hypothetical protein